MDAAHLTLLAQPYAAHLLRFSAPINERKGALREAPVSDIGKKNARVIAST